MSSSWIPSIQRTHSSAPSQRGQALLYRWLPVIFLVIGGTLLLITVIAQPPQFTTSPVQTTVPQDVQDSSVVTEAQQGGTTNAPKQQSMITASLFRLNQLDLQQYRSSQEFDTWAYSACSAASMTEVVNAYNAYYNTGRHYRITDILKVESGLNEISPELGLLRSTGLDHTLTQFGLQVQWLKKPSVDDLVKIGNSGLPIIINFPPDRWSGGHLLILRGGNSTSVFLVDSSRLNMQVMARQTFLKYWADFAAVVHPISDSAVQKAPAPLPLPQGSYSITGKPTITVNFINQVLASYGSPATGKGQTLYDLGVKYDIDPAFALAFFLHESTFGTQGEARTTLSLGNLRCIPSRQCVDQDRGGYAQMQSWEDGFEIWYQLIRNYYIARRGLVTIEQIIPVYAPTADNNNEQAYIASLKHALDIWHAGKIKP